MKELTPLQKIQFEAIEKIEAYIETLDEGAEKGAAKETVRAHEQILYRLRYRKPRPKKENSLPKKNPFKKKILTAGEKAIIAKNQKIDNSGAPINAFKKVAGAKKEAKAINNSAAPKDPFKKAEISAIPTEEEKKGKKFNAYSKLTKQQKLAIWDSYEAKETVSSISEKLWITEKVINKFLEIPSKKTKKASIEVSHNQGEDLQDFVDEVNDSK